MRGAALLLLAVGVASCILHREPPGTVPRPSTELDCAGVPRFTREGCYHRGIPFPRERLATQRDPEARASIQQAATLVDRHMPALTCCYQKGLGGNRNREGEVGVAWTIEPSGDVSDAWVVGTTLPSQAVIDCLGEEICGWRFAPARPVTLAHLFTFKRD